MEYFRKGLFGFILGAYLLNPGQLARSSEGTNSGNNLTVSKGIQISDYSKKRILKFIQGEDQGVNSNFLIGEFAPKPGFKEALENLVKNGAVVQEVDPPNSSGGSVSKMYRIIKTNYFPLEYKPESYLIDEDRHENSFTSKERNKLQYFLAFPPHRKGDSLSFLRLKLDDGERDSIYKEIGSTIGSKGILEMTDCHKKSDKLPKKKCTLYEVFKK